MVPNLYLMRNSEYIYQFSYCIYIGTATINFTSTSYLVNEDVGSFNVCAQILDLPAGGLGCNVTVQLILLNGTACMLTY